MNKLARHPTESNSALFSAVNDPCSATDDRRATADHAWGIGGRCGQCEQGKGPRTAQIRVGATTPFVESNVIQNQISLTSTEYTNVFVGS